MLIEGELRKLKTKLHALDRYEDVVRGTSVITGQDMTTTSAWHEAEEEVLAAIRETRQKTYEKYTLLSLIVEEIELLREKDRHEDDAS